MDIAFEHDTSILIEEFISGKEFRFFVIGDEVVGILHRVPANVTGDGTKTVSELVELKNQDPLRGKGYRTPLEKIRALRATLVSSRSGEPPGNSSPTREIIPGSRRCSQCPVLSK